MQIVEKINALDVAIHWHLKDECLADGLIEYASDKARRLIKDFSNIETEIVDTISIEIEKIGIDWFFVVAFELADEEESGNPVRTVKTELESRLREWRRKVAVERAVPSYIVLNEATLMRIVEQVPRSKEDLLVVSGVGPNTMEKHGDGILLVVRGLLEDLEEEE